MTKSGDLELSDILKTAYFWDVDLASAGKLPERLVIERIVSLGTLSEFAFIIKFFGKKKVEETVINLNYLNPKTLNFLSKYFGRPKKSFKCYIRRQSMLLHWNC